MNRCQLVSCCFVVCMLLAPAPTVRADDELSEMDFQKSLNKYIKETPKEWKELSDLITEVKVVRYDPAPKDMGPSLLVNFKVRPEAKLEKDDLEKVETKLGDLIFNAVTKQSAPSEEVGKRLLKKGRQTVKVVRADKVVAPPVVGGEDDERGRNERARQENEAERKRNEAERERNEATRQQQIKEIERLRKELREELDKLKKRPADTRGTASTTGEAPSTRLLGWWQYWGPCGVSYSPVYAAVTPEPAQPTETGALRREPAPRPSPAGRPSGGDAIVSRVAPAVAGRSASPPVVPDTETSAAEGQAYFWLGYEKFWEGDTRAAREHLAAATTRYPYDARFWYYKGLADLGAGEDQLARAAFDRGAALQFRAKPDAEIIGRALERVQGPRRQLIRDALQRAEAH